MSVTQNVAPVTISFTDTSSGDGLSYLWNFGDGITSAARNPSHTFQSGVWEVTLTVTNDNGTDTSSTVIVATEPVASNGQQQQTTQQQTTQQQTTQQQTTQQQTTQQ